MNKGKSVDKKYLADVTAYLQDNTIAETADHFCVTISTIRTYIFRHKIAHPLKREIILASIKTVGIEPTMKRFDITDTTVYNYIWEEKNAKA